MLFHLWPFVPFITEYPPGKEQRSILLRGSLSTRVFETWKATGSELISLLICPHTTPFTLLSFFSPLEMSSIKILETKHS